MAITVTGTLTQVVGKKMTDPDYLGVGRYSPNTERYLHFVNCCLTAADGRRYFFDSPKVRQTVSSCPGAAVVCFHVEGEAQNWFGVTSGSGIATAEKANTNVLVAMVEVGDVITIRASVKVEKAGYVGLNRIKRMNPAE